MSGQRIHNFVISGVVDKFSATRVGGWVKFAESGKMGFAARAQLIIGGEILAEVPINLPRPDLDTSEPVYAAGFEISLANGLYEQMLAGEFKIRGILGDHVLELNLWEPIRVALAASRLPPMEHGSFIAALSPQLSLNIRAAKKNAVVTGVRKELLAVVCYANDAGAWFDYFYKYYSTACSSKSIYVVTPSKRAFKEYELGGIISGPNLAYDDAARSQMISGLANGLHAYYQWVLVCDVDEIVVPNRDLYQTFEQALFQRQEAVIFSRGLDVVQMEDEDDFDFSQSIWEQRSVAIPNSALSKPHFSNRSVEYSPGYHYCNHCPPMDDSLPSFYTLHLKWACNRTRREVAKIVERVKYTSSLIEAYSKNTVSADTVHPAFKQCCASPKENLDSAKVSAFERGWKSTFEFDPQNGIWCAQHRVADFFVRLLNFGSVLRDC